MQHPAHEQRPIPRRHVPFIGRGGIKCEYQKRLQMLKSITPMRASPSSASCLGIGSGDAYALHVASSSRHPTADEVQARNGIARQHRRLGNACTSRGRATVAVAPQARALVPVRLRRYFRCPADEWSMSRSGRCAKCSA